MEAIDGNEEKHPEYGPINFAYHGCHATLRPWDPSSCVIAAGIHRRLIHFPIWPGSRVFALECPVRTLSHIADIVGPRGRLIGVLSRENKDRPPMSAIRKYFRRRPIVSLIEEDVQTASAEGYERLLGLPRSSKLAFLMCTHERLGAESPARMLATVPDGKLFRRIFEFIECDDATNVSCLVFGHWTQGTRVDMMREVVLSHVDIFQTLSSNARSATRTVCQPAPSSKKDDEDDEEGKNNVSEDDNDEDDKDNENEGKKNKAGKGPPGTESDSKTGEKKAVKVDSSGSACWILLDLPSYTIGAGAISGAVKSKLTDVVNSMKKLSSGIRTGLSPKEHLILSPHFEDRTLLVMKYNSQKDERRRKMTKKHFPSPPGLADKTSDQSGDETTKQSVAAPSATSMPVPSFMSGSVRNKIQPPGPPGAQPKAGQSSASGSGQGNQAANAAAQSKASRATRATNMERTQMRTQQPPGAGMGGQGMGGFPMNALEDQPAAYNKSRGAAAKGNPRGNASGGSGANSMSEDSARGQDFPSWWGDGTGPGPNSLQQMVQPPPGLWPGGGGGGGGIASHGYPEAALRGNSMALVSTGGRQQQQQQQRWGGAGQVYMPPGASGRGCGAGGGWHHGHGMPGGMPRDPQMQYMSQVHDQQGGMGNGASGNLTIDQMRFVGMRF
eukprot:TRINITY_DN54147_c0_g1_i1.p1 TRINITY_DN54147_c0_g1~~TRINITY_DN54147_c0_g1_i1.p1  ORF type:complete len:751 (+),score=119.28 TRINITY_DN54147_c0_g1_i1:247-2253(+)